MPSSASISVAMPHKQLETVPGTYVEGWMHCPDGNADLVLCEPGYADRVLLLDVQDLHSFRFVTRSSQIKLKLRKQADIQAEIHIERQIPPSDQGTGNAGEINGGPISPRLLQVVNGQVDVDEFWRRVIEGGTPMVEPDCEGTDDHRLITFLWRGAVRNVRLIGGPAPDHVWMQRLKGTDLWFASFRVPLDLRLSYRVAPDVPDINASPRENRMALLAVAKADPLNKTPLFSAVGDPHSQWSLFDLQETTGPVKQLLGRVSREVTEYRVPDPVMPNCRRVWVHRPAGFVPGARENVMLVLFDGATYLKDLDLPAAIEEGIGERRLPQIATVFVDSVSPRRRAEDLACNSLFTRHLVDRLLPLACNKIGQAFSARNTVVAGSSFGGLSAAYTALSHSEKIGNFVSLSGSFWWGPSGWTSADPYLASLPVPPGLRGVLTAGRYECARHEGDMGILESSMQFAKRLRGQGADVKMQTYTGGHDYAIWAPALIDAMEHLFGGSSVGQKTTSVRRNWN